MLSTEGQDVLNFVVTGQCRCGASVIQTSVQAHSQATCHADLLHQDEDVRRELHEGYFGTSRATDFPEYYVPGMTNPERYLTSRVFDNPLQGERVIGVKLLYPQLVACDLWEYLHERSLEGDFTVIHVLRNPVACYVSWKQAEQTGVFQQSINDQQSFECPLPVDLDPLALTEFVRWHEAHEERIRRYVDDRLEIRYQELFLDYHNVMSHVFRFLELPPFSDVTPGVRRLKNRNMRERIANFYTVRLSVPADVRAYFDAEDLF